MNNICNAKNDYFFDGNMYSLEVAIEENYCGSKEDINVEDVIEYLEREGCEVVFAGGDFLINSDVYHDILLMESAFEYALSLEREREREARAELKLLRSDSYKF